MSIASRIQAIEQHLTDDYSVLTLAGADLTNVDKNIFNLKPTWKERLLYFMNNGTDEVWNNWDKVNGKGTTLSLNNTEEAPMSLTYKGNTSQSGTPTPTSPQPIHTVSGDNTINVVGKNLISDNFSDYDTTTGTYGFIKVSNESENLTLSITDKDTTVDVTGIYLGFSGNGKNANEGINWMLAGHGAISTNVGNTNAYYKYISIYPKTQEAFNKLFSRFNVQVEKGNQATTYEEYKSASYPISLSSKNLIPNEVVLPLGTYGGATVVTLLDFGEDKTFSNLTLSFNFKDAIYTNSSGAFIDFVKNDGTHQYNLAGSFGISPNVNINGTKYLKRTSETTFRKLNVYVSGYANFTQGFISEAMLVEGTQELPYEAHFSPIELCKIGTYQDKIDKSSGKNLLDTSSMVLGDLNNTTGAEETNTNKTHYRSDFIPVKPNTTYVFTTDYQVTGINKLMEYGSNKSFIIRNSQSSTNKTIMFTTSANTYYFRLCMYTSPAFTDFYSLHNMLNEGTTALPYEPYGTGWYLKKEIGKVVLDGSEAWGVLSETTDYGLYFYAQSDKAVGIDNLISNKFIVENSNSKNCISGRSNNQAIVITLAKSICEYVLSSFKTWLSTNNVEVRYVLATPTYTEITDSTLLSQLNALAKSYASQTNISQENNDMPFILDITALKEM